MTINEAIFIIEKYNYFTIADAYDLIMKSNSPRYSNYRTKIYPLSYDQPRNLVYSGCHPMFYITTKQLLILAKFLKLQAFQ